MCEDRDRIAADDLAVTPLERHAHDAGVVEEEQLAAVCRPGGPGAAAQPTPGARAGLDAGYLDLELTGGTRLVGHVLPVRRERRQQLQSGRRDDRPPMPRHAIPEPDVARRLPDGARCRPAIGRLPTMSLARWRTGSRRAPAEPRPIQCRPCRCSPPLSGSRRTQSSGSRATRSGSKAAPSRVICVMAARSRCPAQRSCLAAGECRGCEAVAASGHVVEGARRNREVDRVRRGRRRVPGSAASVRECPLYREATRVARSRIAPRRSCRS